LEEPAVVAELVPGLICRAPDAAGGDRAATAAPLRRIVRRRTGWVRWL